MIERRHGPTVAATDIVRRTAAQGLSAMGDGEGSIKIEPETVGGVPTYAGFLDQTSNLVNWSSFSPRPGVVDPLDVRTPPRGGESDASRMKEEPDLDASASRRTEEEPTGPKTRRIAESADDDPLLGTARIKDEQSYLEDVKEEKPPPEDTRTSDKDAAAGVGDPAEDPLSASTERGPGFALVAETCGRTREGHDDAPPTATGKRDSRAVTAGSDKRRKPTRNERRHCCDMCDVKFFHENQLIQHKNMHRGEKPYVCELCATKYSSTSGLARHRAAHRVKCVCEVCKAVFASEALLRRHARGGCGKKSPGEERPKRRGERRAIECDHCGEKFAFNVALYEHVSKMHRERGPFDCDACDAVFADEASLRMHGEHSRKYACGACGYRCDTLVGMRVHGKMHAGEATATAGDKP